MALVKRQISPHAARLRREMTDVERMLWQALRNRQLAGFKFRRQVTIGPFIVDFFCAERGLVVEVDGGQHDVSSDAARTAFIEAQGHRVIRFWNHEVSENLDGVLAAIRLALEELEEEERPSPNPLPQAGEG